MPYINLEAYANSFEIIVSSQDLQTIIFKTSFISYALGGKDYKRREIVMHQKQAKVWYPYILRSYRIHCRNILGKIEGSSWTFPY